MPFLARHSLFPQQGKKMSIFFPLHILTNRRSFSFSSLEYILYKDFVPFDA